MKSICLCFEINQPFHFKKYRFFDIGSEHYYYDDYTNETSIRRISDLCYLPANKILLELIKKYKNKFKISFSITGTALEQFKLYAPDVLDSFKMLAKTGQVEFLSETFSHSLSSLIDKDLFAGQIKKHDDIIENIFGKRPSVFRNTDLIYNDKTGAIVADLNFKGMLAEGPKEKTEWKSPNFLYNNALNPKLKIFLRNAGLSDDLSIRFSNKSWSDYPLTADKYVKWMDDDSNSEIFNLFINYETLGYTQTESSGIFDFIKKLPEFVFNSNSLKFATPSEIIKEYKSVSSVNVPETISSREEEKNLTELMGNEMQKEAFNKLYDLSNQMKMVKDPDMIRDWNYLQESDHFGYMCTKTFSEGTFQNSHNPYENPFDAFINYMNVLNDFKLRLDTFAPENKTEQKDKALPPLLKEKDKKIKENTSQLKKNGSQINNKRKKKNIKAKK